MQYLPNSFKTFFLLISLKIFAFSLATTAIAMSNSEVDDGSLRKISDETKTQVKTPRILGDFTAQKACPAYQGLRKKTNPGDIQTEAGITYRVTELDQLPNPSYAHVVFNRLITGSNARWVSLDCGITSNLRRPLSNKACREPGEEDAFVFSLTWLPTLCLQAPRIESCTTNNQQTLSTHGLWPQRSDCPIYALCDSQVSRLPRSCEGYPELTLSQSALSFSQSVPLFSEAGDMCYLDRQWFKHGVCQSQLDASEYFTLMANLSKDFSETEVYAFLQRNTGKTVKVEDFLTSVDQSFGNGTRSQFGLYCDNSNQLLSIYVHLASDIEPDSKLKSLIQKAPKSPYTPTIQCIGDSFILKPPPSEN